MSNNDFSTNMGYNRKISSSGGTSASRVSPSSWNFDTDIDEYTRTNVNLSKETITEEDGSINLDMFLEPDNIETIEKADITDVLELEPEETKKGFFENLGDAIISAGATYVVGRTSVISGIADIGEGIVDGLAWTGGKVTEGASWLIGKVAGWFSDDAEEVVMDWREQAKTDVKEFIATDWVSEANELFYENTELGRFINDASDIKYDSELAQGIRNVTEKAVIVAGATAATVLTGGTAAPIILGTAGFAYGAGNSAENTYQTYGTDTTLAQELNIAVDGGITALNWIATGKAGASAYNGIKTINHIGVNGAKEMARQTFGKFGSKTYLRVMKDGTVSVFKNSFGQTLKDGDTWLETGAVLLDDIKIGVETGEWDVSNMLIETAGVFASNYVSNVGGNYLKLSGRATNIANLEDSAIATFKEDKWVAANVSDIELEEKVHKAEQIAVKYEADGVMSQETFYEVWGTPKGQKPDPESYLPKDYIDSHLGQFEDNGASRITSERDYINNVANMDRGGANKLTGYGDNYTYVDVNGIQQTYTGGSEFVAPSEDVSDIITRANTSENPLESLKNDLGLKDTDMWKFEEGAHRFDLKPDELAGVHLRMPSGNEPGAYLIDWIPGGKTIGGASEAVVDRFSTIGRDTLLNFD